ncbi:hypothetical protein MYX84_12105 [Acidobacteria bacterium AH-259-O06]|nr:hypothetical protein [Acidobacteria bacterium AH-259-O06]
MKEQRIKELKLHVEELEERIAPGLVIVTLTDPSGGLGQNKEPVSQLLGADTQDEGNLPDMTEGTNGVKVELS